MKKKLVFLFVLIVLSASFVIVGCAEEDGTLSLSNFTSLSIWDSASWDSGVWAD